MIEEENSKVSERAQLLLNSLRDSVHKALERKRRLGQYAVLWQDGKAVAIGEDAPNSRSDSQ